MNPRCPDVTPILETVLINPPITPLGPEAQQQLGVPEHARHAGDRAALGAHP